MKKIKVDSLFSLKQKTEGLYLEDFASGLKESILAFNDFADFTDHEKNTEIRRGYAIFEELWEKESSLTIEDIKQVMSEKGLQDKRLQDFVIFLWLQSGAEIGSMRGSLVNLSGNMDVYLKAILEESVSKLPFGVAFIFGSAKKELISQNQEVWEWQITAPISLMDPTADARGLPARSDIGQALFKIKVDFSKLREGISEQNVSQIVNIEEASLELSTEQNYVKSIMYALEKHTDSSDEISKDYFTLSELFERFERDELSVIIKLLPEKNTSYHVERRGNKALVELPIGNFSSLSYLFEQISKVNDLSKISFLMSDDFLKMFNEESDQKVKQAFITLLQDEIPLHLPTSSNEAYWARLNSFLDQLPEDIQINIIQAMRIPEGAGEEYVNSLKNLLSRLSETSRIELVLESWKRIDEIGEETFQKLLLGITGQVKLTIKVPNQIGKKEESVFIDTLNNHLKDLREGVMVLSVDNIEMANHLFKVLNNRKMQVRSQVMITTEDKSVALEITKKNLRRMTTYEAIEMLKRFPQDLEIVDMLLNGKAKNLLFKDIRNKPDEARGRLAKRGPVWMRFNPRQIQAIGELSKSSPIIMEKIFSNDVLLKRFGAEHVKELLTSDKNIKTQEVLADIFERSDSRKVKNRIKWLLEESREPEVVDEVEKVSKKPTEEEPRRFGFFRR